MKLNIKYLILLVCLIFNINVFACINDADTVFFEYQRFPGTNELMSGDFIKHSKEFYVWRIQDRINKLQNDPNNLSYYDDIAVSYEKIGQRENAISVLEKSYKMNPNRYETLANLGTIYIHHQEYQKGLVLLKKAVEINPNAHFGREVYQIKIVEYLLQQNPNGKITLPVQKNYQNFASFILKKYETDFDFSKPAINPEDLDKDTTEILKAMVGVGGMLKFGDSDSPVLLEAMGDLYKELDDKNKQYTTTNLKTTDFGKMALLFYVAAITRNKQDVEQNYNLYEQKFQNYLKVKDLSTTATFMSIYNVVSGYNNLAKEHKTENTKKEIEYISIGGDVEKNIYQNLYPSPSVQEDLFLTQKKNYLIFLNASKEELLINRAFCILILIVNYLLVIPALIKYLYAKYKKRTLAVKQLKSLKGAITITKYVVILFLILNTIILIFAIN